MDIKLLIVAISSFVIGATVGSGYVYNDAINNEAAHFTPHKLGIEWGSVENNIIMESLPDISPQVKTKGKRK